jgi:opacity protein-like surface antigen
MTANILVYPRPAIWLITFIHGILWGGVMSVVVSRLGSCFSAGTNCRLQTPILAVAALALVLIPSAAFAQQGITQQAGCSSTLAPPYNAFTPIIGGVAGATNSIVSVVGTINTAFLAPGAAFVGESPNPQPDQASGGAWGRMIGGRADTQGSTTFTGSISPGTNNTNGTGYLGPPGATGPGASGQIGCGSNIRQVYGGFQVGQDIARLNIGGNGGNLHVGVTGGYAEASAQDLGGSNFTGTFQVPFAGIYANYTRGNFTADILGRGDFYQMTLSAPDAVLNNQRLNAYGFTVSGSLNYRFDLPNSWFIEPSVTGVHSTVKVDTLNLAGGFGNFVNLLDVPPSTVAFSNFNSLLGRAGVRVGTSFTAGNFAWQPFATASVWHEFAGNASATYTAPPDPVGPNGSGSAVSGNLSTTRIGTYGQYSAGIAGQALDSPWLGYFRLDYKEGQNIEAWGFNAGLRYQFDPPNGAVPSGVFVKAAPRSAASYDWTGFYAGGFAGSAWGTTKWDFPATATSADPTIAGMIGGGTIGYNKQFGRWVVGAEGDVAFGNALGGQSCQDGINNIGITANCNDDVRLLVTTTARIGYTWLDDVLIYGKVGGAWIKNKLNASCNGDAAATFLSVPGCFSTNLLVDSNGVGGVQNLPLNDSRFGFTVGAGVEWAVSPAWSAKVEYDYLDFGSKSLTLPDTTALNLRESFNQVKVGLNYHFGAADQISAPAQMVKAQPAAPFNWTGAYAGAEIGDRLSSSAWMTTSTAHTTFPPGFPNSGPDVTTASQNFFSSAVQGGLYAGYNWQFSPRLLAGIEGDVALGSSGMTRAGIPGTYGNGLASVIGSVGTAPEAFDSSTVKLGWDGSVRGRVGFLATPTILVYGTAGVAFQDVSFGGSCAGVITLGVGGSCFFGPESQMFSAVRTGWTAGAGVEGVLTGNWLGKLEFRYSDFGRYSNTLFAGTGDDVTANIHVQTYKFLAGLGYKF